MASKYIVYRDWSRGDIGRNAPGPNTAGMYRGVNCWEYPNGAIGPRPPWQALGITGLADSALVEFTYYTSRDMGFDDIILVTQASVYNIFGLPSFGGAATATAPTTPTNFPSSHGALWNRSAYYCSTGGSGFKVQLQSLVLTNLTTMPAGLYITTLGHQTIIAGTTSVIYTSNLDDPDIWNGVTSANVQIGDVFNINRGLFAQRNTLVIPKFNGDVWQLAGLIGFNEVIRKMDQTSLASPIGQSEGSVVNQSGIWWVSGRSIVHYTGAQAIIETLPDIVSTDRFPINFYDNNPGHVCPITEDDEFIVVGTIDEQTDTNSKKVYMSSRTRKGAWNRHDVPITLLVNTPILSRDSAKFVIPSTTLNDGCAMLAVSGSGTFPSPTTLFQLNARQEFPHIKTSETFYYNQPVRSHTLIDGESALPVRASLTPTEYWTDGQQVEVRSVTIDYSYDPLIPLSEVYNTFTIDAEALRRDDSNGSILSSPITFSPDVSKAVIDSNGLSRGQVTFNFGDQGPAPGFRVNITDWSGILIHRISVGVTETEKRH